MKRLLVLLMALSLSTAFGLATSQESQGGNHCTVQDRIQLGQVGYTKADIDDLCGSHTSHIPASPPWSILAGEGQPRWVQWCVTPHGTCSLNPVTSGYYPIGARTAASLPISLSALSRSRPALISSHPPHPRRP